MKKPQKKNPFKVDHVRSIKLKAKAKQYKGNLKQLKAVVSDQVNSANKQLSSLEEVVRQAPKKQILPPESVPLKDLDETEKSRKHLENEFKKSQESEANAIDMLTSWKCND